MKQVQIRKVKDWVRISYYSKMNHDYYTFMNKLSDYLISNLDKEIIIAIQQNMIDNFKKSLNTFNMVYEAGIVSDYNSVSTPKNEREDTHNKRILESHILFFSSNNLIEMSFNEAIDKSIFDMLKTIDKEEYIKGRYVEPFYAIINMTKYSYDIDKQFSDLIISFLKDHYNPLDDSMKDNATILYHMMLKYSGLKVDYLKTIKTEAYSNNYFYEQLGLHFSVDPNFYIDRYNSIKRKSGYMRRRKGVLLASFDNDVLDLELASLAGKLSSSEQYSFVNHIIDRDVKSSDVRLFSKYASKIILNSKDSDCHYRLMKHISDKDFAFCLPVLVQSLRDHYYGSRVLQERMNEIAKGKE